MLLTNSTFNMSNSQQISDLLKVAKDIPILHTGLNDTAIEYSTYPVKEHAQLLTSAGKPISTPLNSLLTMRNIKIPTDRNDPNYKDRSLLETYKKNALSLTFRGTRTAQVLTTHINRWSKISRALGAIAKPHSAYGTKVFDLPDESDDRKRKAGPESLASSSPSVTNDDDENGTPRPQQQADNNTDRQNPEGSGGNPI